MADLRWNSVNASFNDVNSAMGNAISGISQAGTVFGNLRKSILDEEQRAVDNAFREKQFNEQVSQFAAAHGLNEEQLREQIRHNQESERLTGEGHEVQKRDREAIKRQTQRLLTARQAVLDEEKRQQDFVGPVTPEQQAENAATLKRLQLGATELDNDFRIGVAGDSGLILDKTPITGLADTEQARALITTERNAPMTDKEYADSQIKANELIRKGNYTGQQAELLMGALREAQNKYKNIAPEALASTILAVTGDAYNAWFDWSGSNAFSADDKVVEEFTKNPTNPNNPIAQAISGLVKTGLSNPNSGTGDDKQGDGDGDGDDVDITTLTPQALDYREQQILKSLPTVESITMKTPEVQERFKQLYRESYGNMPESEVPASEVKALKEAALQDRKNTVQQMRTNVTRQTKSELKRKRNQNMLNSRFPYVFS